MTGEMCQFYEILLCLLVFFLFFFPLMVLLIYESESGPLKGHYVIVERKSKLSKLNKEAFLEARETK